MTKSGGFKLLVMLSPLMLGMLPRLQTQSQTSNDATAPQPAFRDPFTLKLRVGKGHDYRQQFDKVPYVADNIVYLFAGDKFGVNVSIHDDEIQTLTYQKHLAKADVDFRFEQKEIGGRPMMLLVITSKLKRRLFMDAVMTVPEKKELYKTSILPLEPGLPDLSRGRTPSFSWCSGISGSQNKLPPLKVSNSLPARPALRFGPEVTSHAYSYGFFGSIP